MIEHLGRVGFVKKHLACQAGGFRFDLRAQSAHLDGHVPVVERVVADVDHAHVAASSGTDDGIFSDFFWQI